MIIDLLRSWVAGKAWMLAGAAGAVLLAALGAQTVRLANAKTDLAREVAGREEERRHAADAARDAEAAARTEETRRAAAQLEIQNAHDRELARLRSDAAIADAAAGRLRDRVASLVAAARAAAANPAPAGGGQAGPDAVDLLADLQRRADERAGELARIADERGAGWQTCVSRYDSLTEDVDGGRR